MACMCGDYCCPSCGPAQGNYQCEICMEWASEGCEHVDPETGEYKPEFREQLEAIAKAEQEAMDRYHDQMAEDEELAAQWRAERSMAKEGYCQHCGEIGKTTGHMDCQYPKDW